MQASIDRVVSILADPKAHVLIAAGAGMSVQAGIDYHDKKTFAKRYPGMVKLGFSYPYQLVGHPALRADPQLMWGYYGAHADFMRWQLPPSEVYQTLLGIVKGRDYFVETTNVDGMFERNGFNPERIYTMQGDFSRMQCLKPCRTDAIWDTRPVLDRILPNVDPETQRLRDPALVPVCPHCGGPAMLNVRGGSWFLEELLLPQRQAMRKWLHAVVKSGEPLVILEIGAGFNTPGCLREPNDSIALQYPGARLVRVNVEYPTADNVPPNRHVPVPLDALGAFRLFRDGLEAQATASSHTVDATSL